VTGPAPSLAVDLLVLAAAGGAFGASIGALNSFALAGLVVVLGELSGYVATAAGVTLAVDLTDAVGFGVVLGPHVAFGGGAAALAYAARRDDALDAKAVTRGLGNRPDVLAVGAAFGVLGHLVATGSSALALPVDPVALGVVGSALLHRVAFGYDVVGGGLPDLRRLASREPRADGGRTLDDWLPYQHRWADVSALGVVMGVLGAYLAYLTASPFLAFGLSVTALALLCAGVARVPVTHHMTLPASTGALALAGAGAGTPAAVAAAVPLSHALLAGAVLGLVGGLAGEAIQRVTYAPAATHLDPPAASIVVTSLALGLLAWLGVLPAAVWIPTP